MDTDFKVSPAIENVIAELEIQRKKIAASKFQGWGAILLGAFAAFLVFSAGQPVIALIVGAAFIVLGMVILYRISDDIAQYKYRFKQEVIGASLNTLNQSITFNHNDGIAESEFVGSQLFTRRPDRYHTEDLISGKDEKTTFYFAEVHAEYKTETQTKNGRQVHWHDILKGIIFTADFNKNFNGVTVVRPKDFGSSIGAWFSKNLFSFGDKDLIQLENEYFNKNFVTYGTDQIEARYILTPAMMDSISELNERSAYCVSLSFINSSVYIAFPLAHNYFEAPVFKTLLRPDLLKEDMNILGFMLLIIRELDLNTRIWTK
ncbi:DUF3137 domain-containing protein [Pedobacter insulae]|uniref:Galanin n=1 Tax=Pedobacter insulae TaxID=414048 RepID=A0A1I2XKV7_9SPHI|nr:DUF3137 domain-containing protein [Pedobacter insulae]SFH14042.1 Protein of unknown function [Pedobacter insulae]